MNWRGKGMVAAISGLSDFSELLHLVEGSLGYFGTATIFKKGMWSELRRDEGLGWSE